MNLSPLDYEHQQDNILGSVVNTEIVENGDFFILRAFVITWKARLREWGIEDVTKLRYSMECYFSDYDFYTKSRGIIKKEDAPTEWIEEYANDWTNPVYDSNGERVILLLGGVNGFVEFVGIGVVRNPADRTSETLFAATLTNQNKEENPDMNFTQEEMDQALANLRNELQAAFDVKLTEVNVQFEQANASLTDRDTQLQDLQTKLVEAEAKVTEFETKAAEAEAELQRQAIAKMVEDRKALLAGVNYPTDLMEGKADFMAQASEEEFTKFLDEFKTIAASLTSKQAAASKKDLKEFVPNLTSGDKDKKIDINLMV